MTTEYCYLNGKIIPISKAKISINDIGLLRGYAIFDFLKSHNGQPLLFEKHLDRLERSAKILNLKLPISRQEIKDIISQLTKKNNIPNAGIRLFLSGGTSKDGLSYNYDTPTFFITARKLPIHPETIYTDGVKLITHEYKRSKPEVKSNNYLTMLSLKPLLKEKEAYDTLYANDGKILEGTTFNFFIFKNNELITPKEEILLGTRRNLVLELAKNKFTISERPLDISELKDATEALLTSTTRDIIPVTQIDDVKIGNGKVGKNTKFLIEKLAAITHTIF